MNVLVLKCVTCTSPTMVASALSKRRKVLNIGLINLLALYARLNEYGFIGTPRRVVDGKVTTTSTTCRPSKKASTSSRANATLDKDGRPTGESGSAASGSGNPSWCGADRVQYMDVSPAQIVSVAASLVPFLETTTPTAR